MTDVIHENRPMVHEKSTSAQRIWLTAALVLGCILLCIGGAKWGDGVSLQHLVVRGATLLSSTDISARAQVALNTPLLKVNIFDVHQRILGEPFIRTATVNREYPDIVRIRVVEREPVASLNCGQLLYVDTEGVLLPPLRSRAQLDLPVISGIAGIQNSPMGEVCRNSELFEALSIVRIAASIDSGMTHFISEINMNKGGDIDLFPADANVRIVLGRGDIGKKLVVLHGFWGTFITSANPEQVEYIDLRFDEEVVVKRRGKTEPQQSATM